VKPSNTHIVEMVQRHRFNTYEAKKNRVWCNCSATTNERRLDLISPSFSKQQGRTRKEKKRIDSGLSILCFEFLNKPARTSTSEILHAQNNREKSNEKHKCTRSESETSRWQRNKHSNRRDAL
jgi:hypothetical protein